VTIIIHFILLKLVGAWPEAGRKDKPSMATHRADEQRYGGIGRELVAC